MPALSRRTDLIVSGAAIFISVCTLVVLLYEARIMREQQRAAVWPYVEIGPSIGDGSFSLLTANQGIGPALIRSMVVTVDGTPVRTWGTMLQAFGIADTSWTNDRTNGRVLPPQETIRSARFAGTERIRPLVADVFSDTTRLAVELCYCSVYDDCWQLRSEGLDRERAPVGTCEREPEREFLF